MKRVALLVAPLLVTLLLVLAGCGGEDSPAFDSKTSGPEPTTAQPSPTPASSSPSPAAPTTPTVVGTIASGLEVPWGIAFLPDGSALVTERDSARVLHIVDRKVTSLGTIAAARSGGESGLLGIAVSPSYAEDGRVFVYATTRADNRVLRMTFRDGRLGAPEAILTGIPRGQIHDGGRLAFGPDGNLYASTGETGDTSLAQDANSLGGKVLRITQDGKPAPGNPRANSPVWTIGHRNVQGLAFDDAGQLWASEFGANDFDELNLIQKGTNYGWPEVEGRGDQARFRNPQVVWRTQDASPSGLAFLDGYLYLGALRGERVWRVKVDGGRASAPQDFFVGDYGRMRTIVVAPDGNLWVTTSNQDGRGTPAANDDRILLVRP